MLWCLLPQAHATGAAPSSTIETLPLEQVRAAVRAAHTPGAVNLVRSNLGIPAQATTSIRVADQGVCVYRPNPAFQRGRTGASLAVPAYVAVTARAADGRTATLQVARVPSAQGGGSSWAAVAAAQDDTEARLAQGLAKGAVLFQDQGPRGREWYVLDQQALRPVSIENGRLRQGTAVPVTTYAKSLRQAAVQTASTPPAPPRTGGTGTETWLLLGAALFLAVGSLAVLLRPRRRTDPVNGPA
ncbi:hypothetical protein ACWDUX_13055 [Streptomyces sp. NPDC003444]